MQVRPLISITFQTFQQLAQLARRTVVGRPLLAKDLNPAVDVPADDEYAAPRLQKGFPQRAVIGGAIDQDGGPSSARNPPTRAAFLEDFRPVGCHLHRFEGFIERLVVPLADAMRPAWHAMEDAG